MLLPRAISRPWAPVCALVLGVTACSAFGHGEGASPSLVPSSPAIVVAPNSLIPATVAALPAMDVGGFKTLLAQSNGTPLVVNFWASWCDPCQAEAPLLAEAAGTHRDIQFLGVDILDDRDHAQRFIAEHGIPYPNVFDPSAAIRTDVGSIGQPVTVFYAADGTQAAKVDGQLNAGTLEHGLSLLSG